MKKHSSGIDDSTSYPRWPVFAGFLVLLAIGILAVVLFTRQALIETADKTKSSLLAMTLAKASRAETFLKERQADALFFANRDSVWQFMEAAANAKTSPALKDNAQQTSRELQKAYGYADVRLLTTKLETVSSLQNDALQSIELDALKQVVETGRPALVDIHVSRDGEVDFGVAQPIFAEGDASRSMTGVVYLKYDLRHSIAKELAFWPDDSASGESVLFRREANNAVRYLTPLRFLPSVAPLSIPRPLGDSAFIATQVFTGYRITSLEGTDYRGVPVFAAAAQVPGTEWILVSKIDQVEVVAPIRALGIKTLAIVLAMLASIGFAVRFYFQAKSAKSLVELGLAKSASSFLHQSVIDASAEGYVAFNAAGHIVRANAAMARLTGYSAEELCQKTVFDIDTTLTQELIGAKLDEARTAGTCRFRMQLRKKDDTFLDAEINLTHLLESKDYAFHAFVRDIGEELKTLRRLQQLNNFNTFLSHVNAAIFTLREPQEILAKVCENAVRDGGFLLAWGGVVDEVIGRVTPTTVFGEAADYVKNLVITLDPTLPTSHGPTAMCLSEKQIVYVDDFQRDDRTGPWHAMGKQYGINASASVPIMVHDTAVAVLTFYAAEPSYFDVDLRALLEESAKNVSLAFETASAAQAQAVAELSRAEFEERYRRAFENSPIPVQTHALDTRALRRINHAHEKTFGYSPSEIADEASWFDKAFADPALREQLKDAWEVDLKQAIIGGAGTVVKSPELRLRCKDGSERVMRGFMSVIVDEILVQWEDLTEIKQQQAQLEENERHFRGMVEQSLSGVYVSQDNKFVYANPRFCNIVGWPLDELLGKPTLDIVAADEDARKQVLDDRVLLEGDMKHAPISIRCRCKDGTEIDLGLHASKGVWEGGEAVVVMAQDITERMRAEKQIAAYIKQLEGTMEGTLQAVAKMVEMVDMRDPYTAGHERRVGIIAADIAREMGWPEAKCQNLQLIGLVHDIGKIAVPAEILSKPTRLSKLEYQIIQGHAEQGYEILKDVEFPLPIAEIIREHHERMDGSGYPQGLQGDQILPEARILAVADVLESMASHRPYRPALGIDVAIKEIEEHREIWFEPTVVDALLRLVREKGYKLPA